MRFGCSYIFFNSAYHHDCGGTFLHHIQKNENKLSDVLTQYWALQNTYILARSTHLVDSELYNRMDNMVVALGNEINVLNSVNTPSCTGCK